MGKIFMPGQVSTDNAGKHSPTFSVYNTLDSYKKIAAYDKQFQSPTFAFGKQKRPIGHHGKGHLRSVLPGPGAYDTTASDFPKMEDAHQRSRRSSPMGPGPNFPQQQRQLDF